MSAVKTLVTTVAVTAAAIWVGPESDSLTSMGNLVSVADDDEVEGSAASSAIRIGASQEVTTGIYGPDRGGARAQAPTQAQVMAARQSYVDDSICLPSSIAGLTLGNICAGRTACDENTLGRYLQNPYLATGTGRPTNCTPTPGEDPAAVVNAAVYQAFREVPLPETVLHIQPPDGTTLVNLETNFFTTAEPFTTTITVLGYTVDLDITPTSYTWDFGDGTTTTTTTPGAPYPHLDITHVYTRTGTYPTRLTTTWSADFRVNNGPWQRVQGTVDMTSPTLDLQVREATPVLTG